MAFGRTAGYMYGRPIIWIGETEYRNFQHHGVRLSVVQQRASYERREYDILVFEDEYMNAQRAMNPMYRTQSDMFEREATAWNHHADALMYNMQSYGMKVFPSPSKRTTTHYIDDSREEDKKRLKEKKEKEAKHSLNIKKLYWARNQKEKICQ